MLKGIFGDFAVENIRRQKDYHLAKGEYEKGDYDLSPNAFRVAKMRHGHFNHLKLTDRTEKMHGGFMTLRCIYMILHVRD